MIKNDHEQSLQDREVLLFDEEANQFNAGVSVSAPIMVFVIVSGMVGTSCMVIPIMGLTVGWLSTLLTNLAVAFTLYYTASLIITHLGQAKSMKESILAHFKQDHKYLVGYGVIIWISFVPFLLLMVRIVCLEIQRYTGMGTWESAIAVGAFCFLITIWARIAHLAEQTMALGTAAFVLYLVFLVWAMATAPSGSKAVPETGPPYALAAALVSGLQIHDFAAQNVLKVADKNKYQWVIRGSFLLGFAIFLFCSLDSFAIVNRHSYLAQTQLITDFFPPTSWYVIIINLSFVVGSITAFPNFLNVSMIRFFQVFKIDLSATLSLKEVLYYFILTSASILVYILGANFQLLYTVNGSVVAFSYVIVIPVWVHLKCIWYDGSSGTIQDDEDWNGSIVKNQCQCRAHYRYKWLLYVQTVGLVALVGVGFVLMLFNLLGIKQIAAGHF